MFICFNGAKCAQFSSTDGGLKLGRISSLFSDVYGDGHRTDTPLDEIFKELESIDGINLIRMNVSFGSGIAASIRLDKRILDNSERVLNVLFELQTKTEKIGSYTLIEQIGNTITELTGFSAQSQKTEEQTNFDAPGLSL